MDSPEDLYESGIYVNDLSMHDSSRDIILAGSQKDPELTLALNQVWTLFLTVLGLDLVSDSVGPGPCF